MDESRRRTVLVTGANSGLGYEASAQFAEAGWERVILACRTEAKAEVARAQLVKRSGVDPFATLAVDTSEVESANAACDQLRVRKERIDFLLLNAGATGAEPKFNSDGVEITWASTLVGHHVMAMRTLADGLLTERAGIVIAGSEGARGNLPGMKVHDIAAVAADSFDGDLVQAIDALARLNGPFDYVSFDEYVTAKLVVAWWAAALARRVPGGIRVNAVSPGSAPASGFGRDAPVLMRTVMMPVMKLIGPFVGMAGSIESAARRYVEAAEFTNDQSGHFYATADRKKLVGAMGIQRWPAYFTDESSQEAGFAAVERLTGVAFPEDLRHYQSR